LNDHRQELSVDTPICSACKRSQRGIVEFRWSDGAVVYECTHCGAFNEVSEVHRHRPAFAGLRGRVSVNPWQTRRAATTNFPQGIGSS
jgi:hypothetical protein